MYNIIRSLNYQTRRDNFTYILLICIVAFAALMFYADFDAGLYPDGLTGSAVTSMLGDMGVIGAGAVTVMMTARICGWDFNDKTINYEILAGHDKKSVFWGRFTVAFVWVTLMCLALISLPVILCTAMNGWGYNAELKGVLVRLVLVIFPIFRTVCEMLLLTFIARNCYASMLVGWIGFEFGVIIAMMPKELFGSDLDLSLLFSSSSLMGVLSYTNYSIGYVDGKDVEIFETALSQLKLYGTIGINTAAGLLCLGIAYLIFKKRDMA